MPSLQRFERSVRPRAEASDEELESEDNEGTSPSALDTGEETGGDETSDSDIDGQQDFPDESGSDAGDVVQEQMNSISFGALAKAQESLSKKRKRGSDATTQQDEKLAALRARLRELKAAKSNGTPRDDGSVQPLKKKQRAITAAKDNNSDQEGSSDSEAPDAEPSHARTSKHAPTAQSSRYQVTRKRTVVDVPKRRIRDPRFDAVHGTSAPTAPNKHYAFLDDYHESEMAELRAAIKKSGSEDEKGMLKRKLLGMESKKKARQNKEREQGVLREHRRREKEAVKQGKKPFYLKKGEQKKLAIVEKFNSMKGKDREKLMERRRKKADQKEKKRMPNARRGADA
ncbi:rRNA biogenesis protein rrp36 [Elasticomyces elasticus]|nr:rRNA biogenesis protein rrp36 [Elasticomyces elasticus]